METHVKVLAALEIAFGAFGLVGAALLAVIFTGAAGAIGVSGDPEAQYSLPIIGITGMALVTFVTLLSLPSIVGGIVLCILSLTMVPFGTIVGAYGLWVLFSKDTERLFQPSSNVGA